MNTYDSFQAMGKEAVSSVTSVIPTFTKESVTPETAML